VARSVARLTAIAAAVLFAGCGGGSTSKSSSGTGSVGRPVVSAKSGAFRTVVPLGFTYIRSQAQYQSTGPEEGKGVPTADLVVIREPVAQGDINAVARRTVRAVRHEPGARPPSGPLALSVGGQPALAVEYVVRENGEESHFRQVFVRHGGSVYYIRESWPLRQASAAQSGFEELLSNWQWQ
jgi:hypothetical protein